MTQPPLQPAVLPHPAAQFAARVVASLFGLGFIPFAAGTVASLLGVATGVLIMRHGSQAALPEALLAVIVLGLLAIEHSGAATTDPGWIVIDELAGQWLAMVTLTHASPIGLAVAFVLFRILDIAKPGPVGWADRRHNAAGVMGDDLVAGAIAAALLWAVQLEWPALLG
jgi:phosphatidylglycerophosphatase A